MLVTVTAEHIFRGIKKSCSRCPIALAVRDLFPNAELIGAHPKHVNVYENQRVRHFDLPEVAKEFINSFDGCWSVEPFSFEMTEREIASAMPISAVPPAIGVTVQ